MKTQTSDKAERKEIKELQDQIKSLGVMIAGLTEAVCELLPDSGKVMQEQVEYNLKINGLE